MPKENDADPFTSDMFEKRAQESAQLAVKYLSYFQCRVCATRFPGLVPLPNPRDAMGQREWDERVYFVQAQARICFDLKHWDR